jgi:hypothetical protein
MAHAVWGHKATPERNLTGRKTGYELRNADGVVLQASETLGVLTKYFEDKIGCVIVDCTKQAIVWPPERVNVDAT